jgi:hypothetical protein
MPKVTMTVTWDFDEAPGEELLEAVIEAERSNWSSLGLGDFTEDPVPDHRLVDISMAVEGQDNKESDMSDKKTVTEANTDSQHTPGPAIWRNQLVQVRKKNTNEQVDSGLVTMVDGEKVCIGENEYPKDQYSFMVLA